MYWQLDQPPSEVCHFPGGIQRAESPQQTLRGIQRGIRRSLEKGILTDVADSESMESQNCTGEIQALNLRRLMVRTGIKVLTGVEAQARPRSSSAGASGPLNRRGLAHLGKLERWKARPGRVRTDSRQPAVDHRCESFDGHRSLGDIGRKDHLLPA